MKYLIKISIRIFLFYSIFIILNELLYLVKDVIYYIDIAKTENNDTFFVLKIWIPHIIICCIHLLTAILLWGNTNYISKMIIGNNNVEKENISLDFNNILSAGIIILGIYFIIHSLPSLFSRISYFIIDRLKIYVNEYDNNYRLEQMIRDIVGIIKILLKISFSILIIKYRNKIINIIK